MAEHIAPPPYDEELPGFVASIDTYQPSAPPRDFGTPYEQLDGGGSPTVTEERHEQTPLGRRAQKTTIDKFVNSYVSYSVANNLRKYIIPKHEEQDPELDVEAQFGRNAVRTAQMAIAKKKRMQCINGWLWCFGVMLIPVYIALPVLMVVFGVIGIGECPFRGDTIIVYLIGGGILLGLMVLLRIAPSLLSCMRARNWCMSRDSTRSAKGICSIEALFYLFLFVNLIVLFLGTYTIFTEGKPPPTCSDFPLLAPNCCDAFVYVSSATFTISQYILYVLTSLYLCLVLCCIRSMKNKVGA